MSNKLKTRTRYIMCGSDFSSQEPRLFTQYCQDPSMLKVFEEGKDLYSSVAAIVYKNNYEDNCETYPDGSTNLDGKKRRASCKSLILGLMYGRGIKSIAAQISDKPEEEITKEDIEEAKRIRDTFFEHYPLAQKWIEQTHEDAKKYEYVEDLWGRKRRFPDINAPDYTIKKRVKTKEVKFNPLLESDFDNYELALGEKNHIISKLKAARSAKEKDLIISDEYNKGIEIIDNTGIKAKAERQSVNARIQGGAASMTKLAMRDIYNDEVMNKIGFRLLIPVHDELIGECPAVYEELGRQRLSKLMEDSGKPECTISMKCDAITFPAWYYDIYSAMIQKEYKELSKTGLSKEECCSIIYTKHKEYPQEKLNEILGDINEN